MLDPDHALVSLRRQCVLLGLNRSTAYYRARPVSPANLALAESIDEQYTRTPFFGAARMTAQLKREGLAVNVKRVRRMMRSMGLSAIHPGPRLSRSERSHPVYPYLLRGVRVERPDQVWSSDITYIRLKRGFVYLTAVLDWRSRYVLSWELSNTLDSAFCVEALRRALSGGRRPEVFNSDQGSQFTSASFTGVLKEAGIAISMDGRGRVYDNIFVERLWRTVKYEEVYLKHYEGVDEAYSGLKRYFAFYNRLRPHQSLNWRTPEEEYFEPREASGNVQTADAAVTAVGLRPPCVTASSPTRFHLKSTEQWS